MEVVLTYTSALEALRRCAFHGHLEQLAPHGAAVPSAPPSPPELRELVARDPVLGMLPTPLDLLVTGGRGRKRSKLVTAHLQGTPLPPGSLIRLTESVLCVSPEQLAVLMAPRLTHLELVFLLSELLGAYAINPAAEDGMTQRDEPLMTRQSLLGHLRALGPRPGTRAVRRALDDACVGSGSPRETKLTLRLALKPALGGQHLHVLSMNEPLEVRRIHDRMKTGVRRPDILIGRRDETGGVGERRIVALEYHGSRHDSPKRLARDAARTNELKAIGIGEYVIRREQYRDLDYMIGLAESIRRELGENLRRLTKAERARRRQLALELYQELERIDGVNWNGRERERERKRERRQSNQSRDDNAAEAPVYERVPDEAYGLA